MDSKGKINKGGMLKINVVV